jgi:flagellar biosynthesis protein
MDGRKGVKRNSEDLKRLIAIALKYNKDEHLAPKVVATGKGAIAQAILKEAKAHGISVHQDRDLALILSTLQMDDYIPFEAYTTVAKIIAFLLKKGKDAPLIFTEKP